MWLIGKHTGDTNQMLYSQYCRIEGEAMYLNGGRYPSRKDMIKGLRSRLTNKGKSFEGKKYRHTLIREMLEIHRVESVEGW